MSKSVETYTDNKVSQVWLITQRCYKRQFLLSDEVDRRRWLYWLYQAKRRFGLSILNYVVTSNHVHLLVQGNGSSSLRKSVSYINEKSTQDINRRHRRSLPLWNKSCQITAIQTNENLSRCMTYIDMNMVRAGVVTHPRQWLCSGYHESVNPYKRTGRLDQQSVHELLGFQSADALRVARDGWIRCALESADLSRVPYWSDSLAVGDLAFALKMKRALAFMHPGRRAQRERGCFAVREARASYDV